MNADETVKLLRARADAQNERGYSGEASELIEIADLIESLQARLAKYDEIAAEYGIDGKTMLTLAKSQIKTAQDNVALLEQLSTTNNRLEAAVEDIAMAHKHGLCEVCGRMPHCLMSLNHGCGAEEGTVCDGDKFEWRGPQDDGKGDAARV